MTLTAYSFQEQMKVSEGAGEKDITTILLASFPTAVEVEKASTSDDRQGTDYWIIIQSGQRLSVDVKVRAMDWAYKHPDEDDVALETWSVVGTKIGWTRDVKKRTDYILWLWLDTGRWMLVPFPMLCSVFVRCWEEWRGAYKTRIQPTANRDGSQWKSECVFVPRSVIWAEIYAAFGGAHDRYE